MNKNTQVGFIFALTTAVIWGLVPIAIKFALPSFDPITIVWYRFTISAFLLLVWFSYKKSFIAIAMSKLKNQKVLLLLFIAVICLLSNFILFATAVKYLTPTASQVVGQIGIVVFMIVGSFVFKERLIKSQIMGIVILIVGLILFFNTNILIILNEISDLRIGLILGFLAAVSWAFYALAQKVLLKTLKSEHILWIIYLCGAVGLAFFASPKQMLDANIVEISALVFSGISTVISYGSLTYAMQHLEAAKVGAITTLTPLFALLFSDLLALIIPEYFDMQYLNMLGYIGAFLVVFGAMLATIGHQLLQYKKRNHNQKKETK